MSLMLSASLTGIGIPGVSRLADALNPVIVNETVSVLPARRRFTFEMVLTERPRGVPRTDTVEGSIGVHAGSTLQAR